MTSHRRRDIDAMPTTPPRDDRRDLARSHHLDRDAGLGELERHRSHAYRDAVAILVDDAVWSYRGRLWAHLVSDVSYDELHAFAEQLGLPRHAFQGDHYDIPTDVRDRAVALGAAPVPGRELVTRLRAAGLRLPPAHRRRT
jgi:hypothetical protein